VRYTKQCFSSGTAVQPCSTAQLGLPIECLSIRFARPVVYRDLHAGSHAVRPCHLNTRRPATRRSMVERSRLHYKCLSAIRHMHRHLHSGSHAGVLLAKWRPQCADLRQHRYVGRRATCQYVFATRNWHLRADAVCPPVPSGCSSNKRCRLAVRLGMELARHARSACVSEIAP